ncbi:MAG: 50S ribosomal protein L22 [Candidatus Magasanikbacteria bacterium GW2011_GWC2_37_14]|uniref:Large ribosomal subunit protein uL22 n=1 Tax=Candidatus Magasanikbacteria bacterium GW2011_GWC2_37_14 TaxID=1619046 RepID=A0A0G0ISK1_9BACT|nr:MAG: 50S ribosomal protein L22 [Candidatus Magasanikbacteria bacterium GW2011_GWC2_37_14]
MKMQAVAKLRYLRLAPRKVRLLADLICGLKIDKAENQLENSAKEAKRPVLKLLRSAIANATNNFKIDKDTLRVKSARVDNGPILYRSVPKAQGRATPIRKRSCHITIVLEGDVESKESTSAKATADKEKKKIEKLEKKVEKKKVEKTVKKVKEIKKANS